MNIILAENLGFCFGVKEAIKMAEEALASRGSKEIYSVGYLIHNQRVIDDLKAKGLIVVDDLAKVPRAANVIIRSHGETKEFYELCELREMTVIDTTCPFVKKIHDLVENPVLLENEKADRIVIVGDKKHPEVIGIASWCSQPVTVATEISELEDVDGENIFLVSQTTMEQEKYAEILEFLQKKNSVVHKNTICNATKERQIGCKEAAKKS
ncbi:MAG: 4-hydroxy-3-methylbut-2-enyl diphosphate reductase, partial [Anaerovoracaceae bacterium]